MTVVDSETTTPKVIDENEALDRLEYRQTLTEYQITHALDCLQQNTQAGYSSPRPLRTGNTSNTVNVVSVTS